MKNCSLSRNCSHTWHLPHSSENLFVCWFFMKDVCWFYDQDLHPGTLQYSALWKCTRWKLLLQRSRWWTGASEEGEMRKAEMFQLRKTLAIASGTTLSPMYVPTTRYVRGRKIFTPEKDSPLKDIHPWKIFTPEKYSPLKNSHHWKIFTPGRLNDWAHKHWMLGWYILVIFCSTPPLPPVIICHHSSSFGLPPPSPSGDDVICEQSLVSRWYVTSPHGHCFNPASGSKWEVFANKLLILSCGVWHWHPTHGYSFNHFL